VRAPWPAWRTALAAALLSTLLVVGVRESGWLQPIELWAYDRSLAVRVQLRSQPAPSVLVVGIDEGALQRFGDPVRDEVLAGALAGIAADGARVIGLDLFRDLKVPPGTARLNEALRETKELVGVYAFAPTGEPHGVGPPPAIEEPERLGFADVPVDPDGVVRRGLLFLSDGSTTGWSFSLRLATAALAPQGIRPVPAAETPRWLRLGATSYRPLSPSRGLYQAGEPGGYPFLLTFPAGVAGIDRIAFEAVVDAEVPAGTFRDKIVLVGLTDAIGSRDIVRVPVPLDAEAGRELPGVMLHAHIVVQLLRQATGEARPLRAVGDRMTAGLALALAGLGAALGTMPTRVAWRVALVGAVAVGIGGASVGALALADRWVASPVLAAAFALAFLSTFILAAHRHLRERAAVFELFGMHLSPRIAEIAWRERDTFLERGRPPPRELTATVLVADLAGFTGITERLAPPTLMAWINRYVETATRLIDEHGGVVEKYAGDGVTGVFGIPIPRAHDDEIDADARAAAATALRLASATAALNRDNARDGLPAMRLRIGIATGRLVAGTVGGPGRLQYTVLGEPANLAARLESYDKDAWHPGCDGPHFRILLSEATLRRLDDSFVCRPVAPTARLRGLGAPVGVHELLARAATSKDQAHAGADRHALPRAPAHQRDPGAG